MLNNIWRSLVVLSLVFSTTSSIQAGERIVDDSRPCSADNLINGDITSDTLDFIRKFTQRCLIGIESEKTIRLYISSSGGNARVGIAGYDMLTENKLGKTLVTIVLGEVASSATLILLAGDERMMSCNGSLLIHEVRTELPAKRYTTSELYEQLNQLVFANEAYASIYVEATGLSRESVREMMRQGTTLGAKDALKLGFATKLIGDCGK